jgi:hypothetical protein
MFSSVVMRFFLLHVNVGTALCHPKTDTSPSFSCSLLSVYSFFRSTANQIFATENSQILVLSLKLLFVFIYPFFLKLKLSEINLFLFLVPKDPTQKDIFSLYCGTLWDFYNKIMQRQQPNLSVVSSAQPLPLAVLFKNRLTWPYEAVAYNWFTAFAGIHYQLVSDGRIDDIHQGELSGL